MPLTVRQAVLADVAVIVEFNQRLAEETEGKTLDGSVLEPGVEAVLADPRKGLYFLAEEDGHIVGQIGLTSEWSDWRNGSFWWIQSVYVRPEARRKGVFTTLYRHIENMARRDPEAIGLRLYVEQANESAQKTYYNLGMERTDYLLLEKYPLESAAPLPSSDVTAKRPPIVVVLAGANGAGKTTASRTLLADRLKLHTFVNADVIAQGLAGFNPDTVAAAAGRIMLQRMEELAKQRLDFAFESTLSGVTLAGWLEELKQTGYDVHLVYFWLANPDLAVARVAERVRKGGHNIPEETIRRRYQRSIQNFFARYRPLATTWEVYNNTDPGISESVAFMESDKSEIVRNTKLWELIRRYS